MAPRYLEDQLERCRRNLRLETIDVFYVHNPESQLAAVDRATFRRRLKQAFETLESAVKSGKVRWYGTATWNAFRVAPSERDYLSLAEVVEVAREVAGDRHHFRFIQLPFNLAMPEAYALHNQTLGKQVVSTLEVAAREGIMVVGSAALYQGQLTSGLPDFIGQRLGLQSDAANAIQFARSAPGVAVALIGMGRKPHVEENLRVASQRLAPAEEWKQLFMRAA